MEAFFDADYEPGRGAYSLRAEGHGLCPYRRCERAMYIYSVGKRRERKKHFSEHAPVAFRRLRLFHRSRDVHEKNERPEQRPCASLRKEACYHERDRAGKGFGRKSCEADYRRGQADCEVFIRRVFFVFSDFQDFYGDEPQAEDKGRRLRHLAENKADSLYRYDS